MDDGAATTSDLLRMVGIMGVCVSAAWIFQILGFGGGAASAARLMWVLGAAAIAGAAVGTIYTSVRLKENDTSRRNA